MVKFAHLADVHLGGWTEPRMAELNDKTFSRAIDMCIQEGVDFVIIAGDLFNTSFPGVERLKAAVEKFRLLQRQGIRLYYIAGSHDFSPSGKTMLDVIEKAGLGVNVARGTVTEQGELRLLFTQDLQTGAKITGIVGKKGMLDTQYYHVLDRASLEREPGFKIFCLHTALTELKPEGYEDMEAAPLSLLPKGFNYYAAGHVHVRQLKDVTEYGKIVYPGPLFPNNFKELESGMGGFYLYDNGEMQFKPVALAQVFSLAIDCRDKIPAQVLQEVHTALGTRDFTNTIVLLRFSGMLLSGKVNDIPFREIFRALYEERHALHVIKNISQLSSREFESVTVLRGSIEQVEAALIREHTGQPQYRHIPEDVILAGLMQVFESEKKEGETTANYEERMKQDVERILRL